MSYSLYLHKGITLITIKQFHKLQVVKSYLIFIYINSGFAAHIPLIYTYPFQSFVSLTKQKSLQTLYSLSAWSIGTLSLTQNDTLPRMALL